MKKSLLILPAMIALFSFVENNNDRLNKVSSNEYLLSRQDPPQIPSLSGFDVMTPIGVTIPMGGTSSTSSRPLSSGSASEFGSGSSSTNSTSSNESNNSEFQFLLMYLFYTTFT